MDEKKYRATLPDILTEQVEVPHWIDGEPNEYAMRVAREVLQKLSQSDQFGKSPKAIIPKGSSYRGYPIKMNHKSDLDFVSLREAGKHDGILLGIHSMRAEPEEDIAKKKIEILEYNVNPSTLSLALQAPTQDLYRLFGYICLTGTGTQQQGVDGLEEVRAMLRSLFADPKYTRALREKLCNEIAAAMLSDERHFNSQQKLEARTGASGHDMFNAIAGLAYRARREVWKKRIARVFELRIT